MRTLNLTAAFLLLGALPALALAQSGEHLFAPVGDVLRHPRCLNCHTATDYPRQTDQGLRHAQLVVRGDDGFGAPTLQCGACHQDKNVADGQVPGAPHWHLAPLSMAWEDENGEGLDDAQLCRVLLDRTKNGDRSVAELVEHMSHDALVLWGWTPGNNRTTPTETHEQFLEDLRAWADAGAQCP